MAMARSGCKMRYRTGGAGGRAMKTSSRRGKAAVGAAMMMSWPPSGSQVTQGRAQAQTQTQRQRSQLKAKLRDRDGALRWTRRRRRGDDGDDDVQSRQGRMQMEQRRQQEAVVSGALILMPWLGPRIFSLVPD